MRVIGRPPPRSPRQQYGTSATEFLSSGNHRSLIADGRTGRAAPSGHQRVLGTRPGLAIHDGCVCRPGPAAPTPRPSPLGEGNVPRRAMNGVDSPMRLSHAICVALRLRAPIPRTLRYASVLSTMGRDPTLDNSSAIVGHPPRPQSFCDAMSIPLRNVAQRPLPRYPVSDSAGRHDIHGYFASPRPSPDSA